MEIIFIKNIFAHTLNLSKFGMISSWKTMKNGWHNAEIATLKTFRMRGKDFGNAIFPKPIGLCVLSHWCKFCGLGVYQPMAQKENVVHIPCLKGEFGYWDTITMCKTFFFKHKKYLQCLIQVFK